MVKKVRTLTARVTEEFDNEIRHEAVEKKSTLGRILELYQEAYKKVTNSESEKKTGGRR